MRRSSAAAALVLAVTATTWASGAARADELAPSSTTAVAAVSTTEPTTTTSMPVPSPTVATTTTTTLPSTTTRAPAARAHAATAAATVSVTTSGGNCAYGCFAPTQTTITAGGTVTFTNPTNLDHTVKRCTPALCNGNDGGTGVDAEFSARTYALPTNGTMTITFTQPGTYVYHCSIHGYALMHGTITVTAALSTTTVAAAPAPVTAPTSAAADDPNALASTGGSPRPLAGIAGALLVVGLAALGLTARRKPEHER